MAVVLEKLNDLGIGFRTGAGRFTEKLPTLVMIHGAGGSSQIWQNQIRPMKDSLNTVALDLPGHGKTAGPGRDRVDEYAAWLKEILALFQDPVFLMGHSLGGAIVQETAISYPELLKGIILVSTGPRLRVAPVFLKGLLANFEKTVDTIMSYAYAPCAESSMIKQGARLMKATGSEVVHNDFLACERFDRGKDPAKIRVPCLIICGDEDKLTSPSLSRALNESIKGSALRILPSAGHMVMIEKFNAFNQCVHDFILS